jgi:hypothetical protein
MLLNHFNACDDDGYIRIFPVLTHNREDFECFRILLLTREQLEADYYADKHTICFDSSRGFDKDATPLKKSRLDTLKTLSAQFNDPELVWLETQTFVNIGSSPDSKEELAAEVQTPEAPIDEPRILSFEKAARERDHKLRDLAIAEYVSNNRDPHGSHPSPLSA